MGTVLPPPSLEILSRVVDPGQAPRVHRVDATRIVTSSTALAQHKPSAFLQSLTVSSSINWDQRALASTTMTLIALSYLPDPEPAVKKPELSMVPALGSSTLQRICREGITSPLESYPTARSLVERSDSRTIEVGLISTRAKVPRILIVAKASTALIWPSML